MPTALPRRHPLACSILLALCASTASAAVRLPHLLSDHMVLQANRPAHLWGWASPGETVTVRAAGQSGTARADDKGNWQVTLAPLAAGAAPIGIDIQGQANTLHLHDVLVGEVWLASGQSNMEKPMRNQRGQKDVLNAEAELQAANHPQIRLFKVKKAKAASPAADVDGEWVVCTPQSLDQQRFSAAAYFFGRRLHTALHTPVGMIDSTWGGTRIEPWTPPQGFAAVPSLKRFTAPDAQGKVDGAEVSRLYNGMIAPLTPLQMKGVIWYQGESNIIDENAQPDYTDKMRALVGGWRAAFGQELPFYYVQVAPHLYHVVRPANVVSPEAEPLLWEAQTDALSIPGTGMVVINDLVDDLTDIHPRDKKSVGERLANMALARSYGQQGLMVSGPRFKSMRVEGNQAILSFDDVGSGLVARDGKALTWFNLAGADGIYHPAHAAIVGDHLELTSSQVAVPVAARFGWDEAARPNLANREGLPAAPFRTKRYPVH
jgi:sialate O-acetylesterase